MVQTAKSLGKFVCRKLLVSVPASAGLELIGLRQRAPGTEAGPGCFGHVEEIYIFDVPAEVENNNAQ